MTEWRKRLIEEKNLSPEVVSREVIWLLADEESLRRMSRCAADAGRPAAAGVIAGRIVREFRSHRDKSYAQLQNA